jgi:1,4-dihydroxy-6-naphthoate synthase
MVVARQPCAIADLKDKSIAVPGKLTTAYLALRMCLGADFAHVVVPFDQIISATLAGSWDGQRVDAGLIIHEGQLTYARENLHLVADMGQWWFDETGLPLPLGANAIRRDLGSPAIEQVHALLRASIDFGLEHRDEALDYALSFGRGLDRSDADQFVGMYVNDYTRDFGDRGREAVRELLDRGFRHGVIPHQISPEFVTLS